VLSRATSVRRWLPPSSLASRLIDPQKSSDIDNVVRRTVDYSDVEFLTTALQGVHTLLSFIVVHSDLNNEAQLNLIDAAIAAGVKRFAPSEWAG
jgi:hypothetical protein